jgi:hypothetical protein
MDGERGPFIRRPHQRASPAPASIAIPMRGRASPRSHPLGARLTREGSEPAQHTTPGTTGVHVATLSLWVGSPGHHAQRTHPRTPDGTATDMTHNTLRARAPRRASSRAYIHTQKRSHSNTYSVHIWRRKRAQPTRQFPGPERKPNQKLALTTRIFLGSTRPEHRAVFPFFCPRWWAATRVKRRWES